MDQAKVDAVLAWPQPKSVRAVRGFLGLASYYRRFIKNYGTIAGPLTKLMRKDAFFWSEEATAAFRALQSALTTASVMQLPDFGRPFVVECDASGSGFGTVLHQGSGPIAFFSKQIAVCHAKLAAYERELIGLVQAVRHWRPYLWGREFVVRTDHYSLKFLLDQRLATIPQHQWASKLLGFDFTVEYKPGTQNVVAHALSRRDADVEGELAVLSAPSFQLFSELREAIVADDNLVDQRANVDRAAEGWSWVDGLMCHHGKIFVSAALHIGDTLIAQAHGTGHEGVQRRSFACTQISQWLMTVLGEGFRQPLRDVSAQQDEAPTSGWLASTSTGAVDGLG